MSKKVLTTPHDVLLNAIEKINRTAVLAETRSDPEALFNCAALLVDIYGRMTGEPTPTADAEITAGSRLGFVPHPSEDEEPSGKNDRTAHITR